MRILLVALLFLPAFAQSDVLLEGGYFLSSYDEAQSETSARVNVGWRGFPDENTSLYVFGGYEEPEMQIRGQTVYYGDIYTIGVGVSRHWGKISAFMEFGAGIMDGDDGVFAQNEVIYTELVANHHVLNRPIPIRISELPYGTHPDTRTEYDLDDAWMGRIGVGYQLFKHLKVSASYRWMSADEYISIKDVELVSRGGGFWEETNPRSLDAFEIGIMLTY